MTQFARVHPSQTNRSGSQRTPDGWSLRLTWRVGQASAEHDAILALELDAAGAARLVWDEADGADKVERELWRCETPPPRLSHDGSMVHIDAPGVLGATFRAQGDRLIPVYVVCPQLQAAAGLRGGMYRVRSAELEVSVGG